MSWAAFAKDSFYKGETVQGKPRGYSMKGKVNAGDIVRVRVHGCDDLRLIKAIDKGRFQIGNYRGSINAWLTRSITGGLQHKQDTKHMTHTLVA